MSLVCYKGVLEADKSFLERFCFQKVPLDRMILYDDGPIKTSSFRSIAWNISICPAISGLFSLCRSVTNRAPPF